MCSVRKPYELLYKDIEIPPSAFSKITLHRKICHGVKIFIIASYLGAKHRFYWFFVCFFFNLKYCSFVFSISFQSYKDFVIFFFLSFIRINTGTTRALAISVTLRHTI